jgi:hypothetical protein
LLAEEVVVVMNQVEHQVVAVEQGAIELAHLA